MNKNTACAILVIALFAAGIFAGSATAAAPRFPPHPRPTPTRAPPPPPPPDPCATNGATWFSENHWQTVVGATTVRVNGAMPTYRTALTNQADAHKNQWAYVCVSSVGNARVAPMGLPFKVCNIADLAQARPGAQLLCVTQSAPAAGYPYTWWQTSIPRNNCFGSDWRGCVDAPNFGIQTLNVHGDGPGPVGQATIVVVEWQREIG